MRPKCAEEFYVVGKALQAGAFGSNVRCRGIAGALMGPIIWAGTASSGRTCNVPNAFDARSTRVG